MSPLAVAVLAIVAAALTTMLGAVFARLGNVDRGLAVVRNELMPEKGPSLRETVQQHAVDIAVLKSHAGIGDTP